MYIYDGIAFAPPTIAFTGYPTAITFGSTVTFTNSTTGATSYSWSFEGGLPANWFLETPPAITYNTPGTYSVTLRATNQFGEDSLVKTDYIYVGDVGFNEHSKAAISIFPNPVKDIMTVQGNVNIREITIYNTSSVTVLSRTIDASSITLNTSDLPAGVYCVKAILTNGTVNKKIVIE
jgi:PKD repeat protein